MDNLCENFWVVVGILSLTELSAYPDKWFMHTTQQLAMECSRW